MFYRISWSDVTKMCIQLARQTAGREIWGIPRGGQIVATVMAYHGSKLVGREQDLEVVVDDIADSGKTLSSFSEKTAALVVRRGCDPMPTYWAMMLNITAYVLFPWEDETEVIKQIEQGKFRSGS